MAHPGRNITTTTMASGCAFMKGHDLSRERRLGFKTLGNPGDGGIPRGKLDLVFHCTLTQHDNIHNPSHHSFIHDTPVK